MELTVLSICEDDILEYADEEQREILEGEGLMQAVMERARSYMWSSIDYSDWYGDSIVDAIESVI